MIRRTQEERRRATQAAVLASALEVLIDDGYANFSASVVAARAGVSRGALERYFPTKNDLLVAVTGHAMDTAVAHAKQLATREGKRTIERFLLDSEHFFFSPVYRAMVELAIAAASDRGLAKKQNPIVIRARKSLNRIWLDSLAAAGFKRESAERFILLTHYLLRGVFLVDTWLPYKANPRAVLKVWSHLAPAILDLSTPLPSLLRVPKSGRSPRRKRGVL
jgi:AcrR family transcriptional regulator